MRDVHKNIFKIYYLLLSTFAIVSTWTPAIKTQIDKVKLAALRINYQYDDVDDDNIAWWMGARDVTS